MRILSRLPPPENVSEFALQVGQILEILYTALQGLAAKLGFFEAFAFLLPIIREAIYRLWSILFSSGKVPEKPPSLGI